MALASIGVSDADQVAAIVSTLKDTENSVRYAANYAVTRIGPPAKAAADVLKGNLADADSFLVATSAWALARVSDEEETVDLAIGKLIGSLKDKNQRTRVIAAKALVELKPNPDKVAPALAEALHDADAEVMANVVEALAAHGEVILPRAITALENEKLRIPAMHLLQRLGPKAKSAVPALVSVLKTDRREEVRQEVIHALHAIGAGSAESLTALISLLGDESIDVRKAATYALGKMGAAAKDALAPIRANADQAELRPISMWAMVLIAPQDQEILDKAVPLLSEALKREESVVRFEAAQALGVAGARAKSVLPALEAAVRDEADMHVRRAMEEAIKKIGG
jgi:HEAT repeat protein